MKATVVIPTKNGGDLFRKVLQQVLRQQSPWPFEVLVVDSGSRDGTLEFVRGLPQVRCHCIAPEQFGHGRTRNLGIELAQGEFIALLTQDALPAHERWLAELVGAADQGGHVAGSFGRHQAYESSGPYIARDLERHFDVLRMGPQLWSLDDPERYATDQHYRQQLHFFSNNNACIRKSVWRDHPFPDAEFAEDQIWAQTIIEAGYAKAYANEALVYHSHTFGLRETCMRSFDEAVALYRLFGYRLCTSGRQLVKSSLRSAKADLRYSRRNRRLWCDRYWLLGSPLQHLSKNLGYYLGQQIDRLPPGLVNCLSRDKKLSRQ